MLSRLALVLTIASAVLFCAPLGAQLVFDDFESYAPGIFPDPFTGQNNWETWDLTPAVTGEIVSPAPAGGTFDPGLQALRLFSGSDVVRRFNGLNTSVLTLTAQTYVPSTQVAGALYFILMNQYGPGGPYNWSVQVACDPAAGLVQDFGGSSAVTGIATTAPLVMDEWAEVRVEIDLNTNTYDAFYAGTQIMDNNFWGASIELSAIDLYSGGMDECYFDDLFVDFNTSCGDCCPFDSFTCVSDCATGDIDLNWTTFMPAGVPYDEITVYRNGAQVATLPGDALTYTDVAVPAGIYGYEVAAECSTGDWSTFCDLTHSPPVTGMTDVIANLENSGGAIQSAAAIQAALEANGRVVLTLDNITGACFPDAATFSTLWVALGTYPSNHQINADEGVKIAELIEAGISVYCEGGDTWGFDADTAFSPYDGIDSDNTADGDDSFISMTGEDSGFGIDFTGMAADYVQDQAGSDWTDQLAPATLDIGGPNSGPIWRDAGLGYIVATYYASDIMPVICQSWEFGGYTGDQAALMAEYLSGLGGTPPPPTGPEFRRGDVNSDGGFNIADAVALLGSLFSGGAAPLCDDAADANDDGGLNIADAVSVLASLFSGAAAPPAPGPTDCGEDPTDDTLDCAEYTC